MKILWDLLGKIIRTMEGLVTEQKPRKCTKNDIYTVERNSSPSRWVHVDAKELRNSQESHQYGGDTVRLKCPHCGIEWTEELPQ